MITLFHDYTSPASAVAVLRLHRLLDEGHEIGFEGFEVVSVERPIPVTLDVLAELDRHADEAAALGLRLRRPSRQPPTVLAHLAASVAGEAGAARRWRELAYRAFWGDGVDLTDAGTLADLVGDAGGDADVASARLADRGAIARMRQRLNAPRSAGVGGVPTVSADGTLVPGLLALDDLRELAGLSRR